jgi:hypothetical protein
LGALNVLSCWKKNNETREYEQEKKLVHEEPKYLNLRSRRL